MSEKRTDPQLQELCRLWQRVLRLQDWDVKIQFKRHYQMSANRAGECDMIVRKKLAVIAILDPDDYNSSYLYNQDIEKTLVHELCHLHLTQYEGGLDLTIEEQAVESFASGFVNLKRFWSDPNVLA